MKELTIIGNKHGTDKAIPEHNFTEFYDEEFNLITDNIQTVLEIGIAYGSSLRMWQEYFPNAMIHGIDIDPKTMINENRIISHNLNEIDFQTFDEVFKNTKFDIIIDDGSHIISHQKAMFLHYIKYLTPNGYYILEDLHTSFMNGYIDDDITTYEFLKSIDKEKYDILDLKFFHNMDKVNNVDCITCIIKMK